MFDIWCGSARACRAWQKEKIRRVSKPEDKFKCRRIQPMSAAFLSELKYEPIFVYCHIGK